jgi:excisionase family DNA binding protein
VAIAFSLNLHNYHQMRTARRSFYTTFEISQICEVNPTTVQNWVKEKKLKAYVTPGGHRRIRREDLKTFMLEFGMPLPAELCGERSVVLIVDDEPEMLDLLASAFASAEEEVEVLKAPGGVEALILIGERKPELLIIDILMPGMNGLEVCRKLKQCESTRNIRIVAISGDHDPGIRMRSLQSGADLFFTKPLDIAEFREASLRLMRSS